MKHYVLLCKMQKFAAAAFGCAKNTPSLDGNFEPHSHFIYL